MRFIFLLFFFPLWLFAQTTGVSPPIIDSPGLSSIPKPITQEELRRRAQNKAGTAPSFSTDTVEDSEDGLGPYRKKEGNVETVKIEALLLDRYKDSVVRIRVMDHGRMKLGEAMGVAVGLSSAGAQIGDNIYIATPLSLLLRNPLQWGDIIEVEHYSGTRYNADIAVINEKLDTVLLKPKNYPQPIRFVEPENERNQLDVITISFRDNGSGGLEAASHPAVMAATNSKAGTLAISGAGIGEEQVGTAILNMQGQLMGMLLPNNQGVLSSAISSLVKKARDKKVIPPIMLGVIMGKGVLVDKNFVGEGAYISVKKALEDIKNKKAPKADLSRFIPSHQIYYRKTPRVILKVGPGDYKFNDSIKVPSNISIAGSGSNLTTFSVRDPKQSVLLLKNAENVYISNIRFKVKEEQSKLQSTIFIQDSNEIILLGNLVETMGGRGVHALGSKLVSLIGNAFPNGKNRAVFCQKSSMKAEANSFLGPYGQAVAVGKNCSFLAKHNLFMGNQIGVAVSGRSSYFQLTNNTFIHTSTGVRFYGYYPKLEVEDNLFYKGKFSFFMTKPFRPALFGENSSWGNAAFLRKQRAEGLRFLKGKPVFRNPRNYDFRLEYGSPGSFSGSIERGASTDMGAFQSRSFLGNYTRAFLLTLETATGEKNLAEKWGYK